MHEKPLQLVQARRAGVVDIFPPIDRDLSDGQGPLVLEDFQANCAHSTLFGQGHHRHSSRRQ